MLFHKRLYVDEKLSKTKSKVIKKLKQGNLQLGVQVITLASNDSDMLEIYPACVLLQRIYKESDMMVVGVASDREAAEQLLLKMTDDCMKSTGDVKLKEFFMKD